MRYMLTLLVCLFVLPTFAETPITDEQPQPAFIKDNLYVYLHSGPTNRHRIIGSITAGAAITIFGENEEGTFLQVMDHKNRKGWVEKKHISYEAGRAQKVLDQERKLAAQQQQIEVLIKDNESMQDKLSDHENGLAGEILKLKQEKQSLVDDIQTLTRDAVARDKVDRKQQAMLMNDRMAYGAGILAIGMLVGYMLSLLTRKSKSTGW